MSGRGSTEWLTPDEAAALFGISRSAVYERVRVGALEARRQPRRMLVRKPAEVPSYDGTLSSVEVAAMLGMNPNSVGPLVSAGKLPAMRRGRVLHFRPEDVEAYIDAHRVQPGTMPWSKQHREPETGRWR